MAYSDTHFGMEDQSALSAALTVANWWAPDIIINVGDTLDCYQASTFKKDIGHASIQRERDLWAEWAEKMNVASGSKIRKIVRGNHDMRFASLVLSIGALSDIEELSLDSLLYLDELGYDPIVDVININPSGDDLYPDAQMYVFHGEKASSFAGGAARAASDMYAGASVIVGHNHKTGVFTERSGRGVTTSYEIGTLAKLNPEYHLRANWSQSVITGYLALGYHDVRVNMIDRGVVVLDGKEYSS
jgi:metallophosphoesterase superfamily enzyme